MVFGRDVLARGARARRGERLRVVAVELDAGTGELERVDFSKVAAVAIGPIIATAAAVSMWRPVESVAQSPFNGRCFRYAPGPMPSSRRNTS